MIFYIRKKIKSSSLREARNRSCERSVAGTTQSLFIVIASTRQCARQSNRSTRFLCWIASRIHALATTKLSCIFMLLFSTLDISLAGCTTCANAVPNNEPTMAEIYETAMQQSHCSTLEQIRQQAKRNSCYVMKVSTTSNNTKEINPLFPTLPNPQLIMYVYPHLSQLDEAPVPGYTTGFSLYEKNYYAVEGESL